MSFHTYFINSAFSLPLPIFDLPDFSPVYLHLIEAILTGMIIVKCKYVYTFGKTQSHEANE